MVLPGGLPPPRIRPRPVADPTERMGFAFHVWVRMLFSALCDADFLDTEAFYAAAWARYDIAKPGSLRFLPMPERIPALRHDYREMAVMIFGDPPKFDLILDTLSALEREVNAIGESPKYLPLHLV